MTVLSTIGIAALRAAEARFTARAENIANANIPGYSPAHPELISGPNGPIVRISRADKSRPDPQKPAQDIPSQVNLPEEFTGLIALNYDFRAAAKLLRTQDELNGSLLDILA